MIVLEAYIQDRVEGILIERGHRITELLECLEHLHHQTASFSNLLSSLFFDFRHLELNLGGLQGHFPSLLFLGGQLDLYFPQGVD